MCVCSSDASIMCARSVQRRDSWALVGAPGVWPAQHDRLRRPFLREGAGFEALLERRAQKIEEIRYSRPHRQKCCAPDHDPRSLLPPHLPAHMLSWCARRAGAHLARRCPAQASLRAHLRGAASQTSPDGDAAAGASAADFTLSEEQGEFQRVAEAFAREQLAPFSARWDAEHHFPVDTLRRAAELGFGGLYVGEDVGGEPQRRRPLVGRSPPPR